MCVVVVVVGDELVGLWSGPLYYVHIDVINYLYCQYQCCRIAIMYSNMYISVSVLILYTDY